MPEKNRESERLRKAMDELVALNKIAGAINALMAVEDITSVIVDHCVKKVGATQGAVFLIEEEQEDHKAERFKTFVREYSQSSDNIPFHLNESLSGWMIKNKTILISNNTDEDDRFRGLQLGKLGINSILAAPLLSRHGLSGTLVVFNKKDANGFSSDDKRFLGIVGSQAANVIENARLKEKEEQLLAIEKEIKVARSIQQGFLPKKGISLDSCEVLGFNIPAKEVGGDYYDIVQLGKNRIFLSLGDVSGKGMPAALLMANAQAVLRSQLLDAEIVPLPQLARSLNHLICQFTPPEQFITAFFGLYDASEGAFRYINAGHEPPIIIRNNGEIEVPNAADLIIGVVPDYLYNENKIELSAGDVLFIFTDGVTETFNETGDDFGDTGIRRLLKTCDSMDAFSIGNKILTELKNFRGSGPQTDDITMLILKIK